MSRGLTRGDIRDRSMDAYARRLEERLDQLLAPHRPLDPWPTVTARDLAEVIGFQLRLFEMLQEIRQERRQ